MSTRFLLVICMALLSGCEEESESGVGVVRFLNLTATKDITYVKYKRHEDATFGGDLLSGSSYLPPGGAHDFIISTCNVSLDLEAGSLVGLWSASFNEFFVPCGGILTISVTD